VTGTAVNPVRYEYSVEQDGGVYRLYKKEIKLDANGSDTSEWTKTYTDAAGRVYKTVYAASSGTPNDQSYFNPAGQLSKQVDPDGVTSLFYYNAKGELQDSVLDVNRDGAFNTNGLDRVTRTIRDVVYNATYGTNVQRSRTFVFPNDNDGTTTNETSRLERSTDGLRTWQTTPGLSGMSVVTSSQTSYNPATGTRTETTTAPDGSYAVKVYTSGRLTSSTQYAYGGTQIRQTTCSYDPHGEWRYRPMPATAPPVTPTTTPTGCSRSPPLLLEQGRPPRPPPAITTTWAVSGRRLTRTEPVSPPSFTPPACLTRSPAAGSTRSVMAMMPKGE